MRKDRIEFKIECKPLTPKRKKQISIREVPRIGRPIRVVFACGGVYLFFLGTDGSAPSSIAFVATLFAVVGIVAVLLAIFIQEIADMFYFSKAINKGSFPAGVIAGKGGLYINTKSSERHIPFSGTGKVKEQEEYFKIPILTGDPSEVFLFKEDFEEGDPEAFLDYLRSK